MDLFNHAAAGVTLAVALTAGTGCSGNTALVGRDSLPGRASQSARSEIVRTVERVDTGSNEFIFEPVRVIPAGLLIARRLG
jgi:hypothetical protein